ncbi:MAG: pilus assembly protein [Beijerinckiaceae bacterium]|nr:pilus assembly protein [Beijerinckiaceae bacterium]
MPGPDTIATGQMRRGARAGALARAEAFIRETRGATAVEFALIAPMLLVTIIFIMSIGYMIFMNQALDYATQKAARQIRTGQVQTDAITTQSAFATQIVCPLLPSFFTCSNVIVNSQNLGTLASITNDGVYPYEYNQFINTPQTGLTVPGLSNASTTFCTGNGSSFIFLQILYPVPFFLSFLSSSTIATTYNGTQVYLIMSTATFLNEPFSVNGNC